LPAWIYVRGNIQFESICCLEGIECAHQLRIFMTVVKLHEWRDFQLDWSSIYLHIPNLRIPAHQERIFLVVVELQEWRDFQLDWSSNYLHIPSLRIPAHQVRIFMAVVYLQEWRDFQQN
jgi:hypothetical protein